MNESETRAEYIDPKLKKSGQIQVGGFELWQEASFKDTLKVLGPMSDEEYNYYRNL